MTVLDDSNYWEEAFQIWYMSNQPQDIPNILKILPAMADGEKPSYSTVRNAIASYGWKERADALNAQASQKNDVILVERKAAMLRRQAEDAMQIADKAKQHILEDGFDTSSSAVQAYFKATEEERTVRGVSEMLLKISKMTPDELMARAASFLKRRNEAIDADVVEDNSADSSSTTS